MAPNDDKAPTNRRATRSRYSSPMAPTNGALDASSSSSSSSSSSRAQGNGSATNGAEGQKTFMQRWLEPPVQVKASYQEAGLVRQPGGVFENMAPLGTLPKVGLFKKTAPPPAAAPEQRAPTRIIIKTKPAAPSTPVPAPPPPPVAAAEEDETEADETEEDDDDCMTEDQDEEDLGDKHRHARPAKEGHKARTTAAAQRSRRSVISGETDDEEWAPSASAQKGKTRRSSSRASIGSLQRPAAGVMAGSRPADKKEFIDKVVEAAVDEALSHFRYPTAWALHMLYDENSSDTEFLTMITKVLLQTANADELEEFARLIHAKKKEGKKNHKARSHFVPAASTSTRSTPHPPKRAPYGSLVKFDVSTLRLGRGRSKSEGRKRERPVEAKEPGPEEPAQREPEPEPAPEPELPPRKKRKAATRQQDAPPPPPSAPKMATTNGVGGKANAETPSRRRTRARSVSSTSSLSSARSLSPPEGIQEDRDDGQGVDETPSRTSPTPPQPITAAKRRRSNAPRKTRNVSPSQRSPAAVPTSTPAPQQPAAEAASSLPSQRPSPAAEQPAVALDELQPYEMPAVVDSPLFPNLNPKKGSKSGTPTLVIATKLGKLDPEDPKLHMRERARKVTSTEFPVSSAREPSLRRASGREELEEPEEPSVPAKPVTPATALASRTRTNLPSARPTPAPREGRSTRSALKRTHDELEDQPSPTTANFAGSEAASTAADSRAGTPALRPAKKPRTGLRVKNSPMKKKNGTSAGIPRPSGERNSPGPVGNVPREDDNDDYCSSCGGNGELICCDGCTRSFHFGCVDPVLRHDAMPVEWFCNVCRATRDPAHLPSHSGPFAALLEKLDARNSSAFRLPGTIRDRFEGVRTGADGEYEEITPVLKPARKKKNADDEAPDFYRLRDGDGNAAICHSCNKSSGTDRAIVPCSICGLWWHLDCLDPPVAYPPALRTWKCPLHADDLLASLPATLHPAHKYRKVKDVPIIRPAFTRGFVNNGFVEIDLDDAENESGWNDVESFGRTVRLSEQGIKLDFISRIRERSMVKSQGLAKPALRPMEQRSLDEQQAALNLAHLSSPRDGGISALVDAMITQADPSVIDIMARADPGHLEKPSQLNQMDQQSLRAILARAESMTQQIRHLLASAAATTAPTVSTNGPADHVPPPPPTVPSLTNSHSHSSPDFDESEEEDNNSANMDSEDPNNDNAMMDLLLEEGENAAAALKSPASPATATTDDDDVPAMTQGEKTPVQGDGDSLSLQSLEQGGAGAIGKGSGSVPPTPTKGAGISGDELVVLEAGGEGEKVIEEGGGVMGIE
ncbi:hypothetical protein N658DRAFT_482003 [Parathielavia hyrcaniae]|uniref:PHD-type domain-containing protein n=1 Tax=Parathielavia hyrcaniae TaxID=113614 RepID=A0AAN6QAN9_9PEZI|nr:hypothetical protein N658DRAFT_482003 [Parathielavia hyrcaniae]